MTQIQLNPKPFNFFYSKVSKDDARKNDTNWTKNPKLFNFFNKVSKDDDMESDTNWTKP
jgi:hypothetical protein